MIIKNHLKVNDKYTNKNLAINPKIFPCPLDNIKMNHIFALKVMEMKFGIYYFSIFVEKKINWWWGTVVCNMSR